jgi:hypothetical protein
MLLPLSHNPTALYGQDQDSTNPIPDRRPTTIPGEPDKNGARIDKRTDSQGHQAVVTIGPKPEGKLTPAHMFEEDKSIHIVLHTKNKTLTFYDQKAWDWDLNANGIGMSGITDAGPRDYGSDYEFYPSPNAKALFAKRHIGSRVHSSYLYRQIHPGNMTSIFPNGYRFDIAALRYFAHRTRVGAKYISNHGHARGVLDGVALWFEGWDKKSQVLYFELLAGRQGEQEIDWPGYYDLETGKFGFAKKPAPPAP